MRQTVGTRLVWVAILTLVTLGWLGGSRLEQAAPHRSDALPPFTGVSGALAIPERAERPALALESPATPRAAVPAKLQESYGRLPLHFEENRGQADPAVKFLARGPAYSVGLTSNAAVLHLRRGAGTREPGRGRVSQSRPRRSQVPVFSAAVIQLQLVGANPHPELTGEAPLPGRVNYFRGKDPAQWRTNIPIYAKVRYRAVYPGIDLIYYGNQRRLEHDFIVSPGADPALISIRIQGGKRVALRQDGALVLGLAAGEVRLQPPLIYQEVDGRRHQVAGGYVLKREEGERPETYRLGFQVAAYDTTKPLVIDPVLAYSTYLGGTGDEQGLAIAVDSSGNAYVTGSTNSLEFPVTTGAYEPSKNSPTNTSRDVFVTKLNPAGAALVFSTYLGGAGNDIGRGIAVDAARNVYVAGETKSSDFPTSPNAFQTARGGTLGLLDAFVTKLDASGATLAYSTYLGGSGEDWANGIAVDASGNAYVAGDAVSSDFPTTAGAFQTTKLPGPWVEDAFVTKVNPTGTALVYSTYLAGNKADQALAIAVDTAGSAYVTGYTTSTNFPTTAGAFDTTGSTYYGNNVNRDAFVTKLNPDGKTLAYSTYLGGVVEDMGYAIAVDSSGSAYVAGSAVSYGFPTTPGAYATINPDPPSALTPTGFVSKFNTAGTTLLYSTFLGGTNPDRARAIAVDSQGRAYVTGNTCSPSDDFPTTADALDRTINRCVDAFFSVLSGNGTSLVYSTFLGGTRDDYGLGIAVDPVGSAYITGNTNSADFPATSFDTTYNGPASEFHDGDVFVTKIAISEAVLPPTISVTAVDATATESPLTTGTFRITLSDPAPADLTVYYSVTGTATAGSDYQALGNSVTIPKGASFKDILVTPIADALSEGPETAILTLTANAAYVVGSPSSATVTITVFYRLTVTLSGSATGTVTRDVGGINCPGTCTANFTAGTLVTLTRSAGAEGTFREWRGACTGAGLTCQITMNAAKNVTAVFSRIFTDDPLVVAATPIKALHFTELREAINTLRSRYSTLTAFPWTDPSLTPRSSPVKRTHLTDLRNALDAAYSAASKPKPAYTDPTVTAGTTPIRAVHLNELRTFVREME